MPWARHIPCDYNLPKFVHIWISLVAMVTGGAPHIMTMKSVSCVIFLDGCTVGGKRVVGREGRGRMRKVERERKRERNMYFCDVPACSYSFLPVFLLVSQFSSFLHCLTHNPQILVAPCGRCLRCTHNIILTYCSLPQSINCRFLIRAESLSPASAVFCYTHQPEGKRGERERKGGWGGSREEKWNEEREM